MIEIVGSIFFEGMCNEFFGVWVCDEYYGEWIVLSVYCFEYLFDCLIVDCVV